MHHDPETQRELNQLAATIRATRTHLSAVRALLTTEPLAGLQVRAAHGDALHEVATAHRCLRMLELIAHHWGADR